MIDPHSTFGIVLTFVSISILILASVGFLIALVYGAIMEDCHECIAILLAACIFLPLLWLLHVDKL